eukprot:TRINITY_DN1150_c0_g1_i3.p1 TRINITY_DN1150_c0_g1~~TRINITY_DN1150_c0_g1_i3.p1  ORF type:complete len:142 (-),score=25.34 TRINITY_DN1150_c0_g1_i3:27-428(-)
MDESLQPPREEGERLRFLMELEFVQCLANPLYLHFLVQNRYFQDETFLNYLKYLLYWKDPRYSKYLVYPMCLNSLELLQDEAFRNCLNYPQNIEFIHRQQFNHWRFYRNNQMMKSIKNEEMKESQVELEMVDN